MHSVLLLGRFRRADVRACDRVRIEDCVLRTGDDAVAGYANRDVVVRRCELNTACSAFRFGGTRVLIEDCRAWGPGTYPIRNSLPKDDLVEVALGDEVDHLISKPKELWVEISPSSGLISMEVVDRDDVRHIIKLRDPMMLPPPADARQAETARH